MPAKPCLKSAKIWARALAEAAQNPQPTVFRTGSAKAQLFLWATGPVSDHMRRDCRCLLGAPESFDAMIEANGPAANDVYLSLWLNAPARNRSGSQTKSKMLAILVPATTCLAAESDLFALGATGCATLLQPTAALLFSATMDGLPRCQNVVHLISRHIATQSPPRATGGKICTK